jgi:hypothetical protein
MGLEWILADQYASEVATRECTSDAVQVQYSKHQRTLKGSLASCSNKSSPYILATTTNQHLVHTKIENNSTFREPIINLHSQKTGTNGNSQPNVAPKQELGTITRHQK